MNNFDAFDKKYCAWQTSAMAEFIKKHPEYRYEHIEICENGDVFVHGNCAYPIIFYGEVKPYNGEQNYE